MGLSNGDRKTKIPDDPRNTKWARDQSAPGFRLLSSMGWTAESPSLGLAASQDLITAGGSRSFSKKVSIIPIAKSDTLGIGAKGNSGIGSLRMMGQPATGGMGMGFVTASSTTIEDTTGNKPAKGGEFGRLLERLNAASASASPVPEVEPVKEVELDEKAAKKLAKKERKAAKEAKREAKRLKKAGFEAPITPIVVEVISAVSAILKNPRMAARSKHLRAKRMASMNATAMAEILGIAPPEISTSSGSASPAIVHQGISSASIQPVSYTKLEEVVSPARTDGNWPIAPPRSFPAFASSSSTTLAATFDPSATIPSSFPSFAPSSTSTLASTFPKFASSSSSTIAATFTTTEVVAEVVEVAEKSKKRSRVKGDEQEEAERKRLKKEKKLAKLA